MRRQRGQAAVELAAVAPLVVLLALALAQVVLAARAGLQAERRRPVPWPPLRAAAIRWALPPTACPTARASRARARR